MSDAQGASLDGRAFVGWLEGRRPDMKVALSDSENRAVQRFRKEKYRASLAAADRICVRLSLHIDEVPEWIWNEARQSHRQHSSNKKDEAVAMFRDGASLSQVSEELDVPRTTIRAWRSKWAKANEVDQSYEAVAR